MSNEAVFNFAEIAANLKRVEANTAERVNGAPLEEPKPELVDIDWTGMYGYPVGYRPGARLNEVGALPGATHAYRPATAEEINARRTQEIWNSPYIFVTGVDIRNSQIDD